MRSRSARYKAARALRLAVMATMAVGGAQAHAAETVTTGTEEAAFAHSLAGSYLAGRFARSENDTRNAASFYGSALVFDPASDMLMEQALLMEASQGSWDRALRLAKTLAAKEPQHRMARMFMGLAEFKDGNFQQAEDHFKAASSGPIGELTSSLAMAWIKLAERQPEAALNLLAVPRQAEWAQFYLRYHRALIADAAGRRNEAHAAYDKVFKQDGRTLRIALAYTRSLANAGDIRGARAVLKEHLGKSSGEGHPLTRALMTELQPGAKIPLLVSTPQEGLAEVFYGLGESLIAEGAIGVGIVYLQMALHQVPDHPFALAALANAYEANRQYAEAIAVYDRIPKGSPLEPAIEMRKAFNLNSLDRSDEARQVLERLLSIAAAANPAAEKAGAPKTAPLSIPELKSVLKRGSEGEDVRELQGALGRLGYDIGTIDGRYGASTETAVRAFQKASRLKPDGRAGQTTFTAALQRAEEKDPRSGSTGASQAGAIASPAALDPVERLQALDALGNILRSRKLYAEAVDVYDRAIAMITKPERRQWAFYYARGTSYERLKNWPAAEKDLKKALELFPDQPLVLNYLGYSWVDQGINLDEGMALIERAVAVKPDDGYIVDSLGWAHYMRGNYKEAVRYLERAVELRPDDPVLNDHLGDALWRVGREREARFQWEQALSLKPEPEDETKIRRKLSEGLTASEKPTQAAVNGAADTAAKPATP